MDDWHEAVNTRHQVVRRNGWDASPPSLAAFVQAALGEPNVLRRPLLLRGDRAIFSRDAQEIRDFLA